MIKRQEGLWSEVSCENLKKYIFKKEINVKKRNRNIVLKRLLFFLLHTEGCAAVGARFVHGKLIIPSGYLHYNKTELEKHLCVYTVMCIDFRHIGL